MVSSLFFNLPCIVSLVSCLIKVLDSSTTKVLLSMCNAGLFVVSLGNHNQEIRHGEYLFGTF